MSALSSYSSNSSDPSGFDFINAGVWRAGELGDNGLHTLDTGYTALNRVLPGGGWPQGAMVEILQAQAGQCEWGLMAPVLAGLQRCGVRPAGAAAAQPRSWTVLAGAPHLPFGPALGALKLDMHSLLSVHGRAGDAPSLLWATREALQCADVAAVLAWLPDARSAHLRRLQIAAHAHNKLLIVFRPLRAQNESSPAPLRLLLQGTAQQAGNLNVAILKRRGPPLALPVLLDTQPARLSALLLASRERARRQREELSPLAGVPQTASAQFAPATASPSSTPLTSPHVHELLDRLAHLHHA